MGKRAKEHNKKIAKRNEKIKTAKRVYDKTREKFMMQLIRQMEDEKAKKMAAENVEGSVTEVEATEIIEKDTNSREITLVATDEPSKAWVDQLPKE